ncbi:MAG: ttcA, partial [Paucimonas sp.]|nr:ttcA [Paucimonas sp.]
RKQIKGMLREWEKKFPGRVENISSALSTVVPSHLMDRSLFDFTGLSATGIPDQNGDIAFDEEPCSTGSPTSIIPLTQLD